jgi:hypothetical protein
MAGFDFCAWPAHDLAHPLSERRNTRVVCFPGRGHFTLLHAPGGSSTDNKNGLRWHESGFDFYCGNYAGTQVDEKAGAAAFRAA